MKTFATESDSGRARSAALTFIMITVVLDSMAFGIVQPQMPALLRAVSFGDIATVGQAFGLMMTAFAVMQFFASPVQGALSDQFGRRPLIIASTVVLALDYIIMALAPNVGWLLVGRLMSGAAAGSLVAAYSYVADVTPPDKMAARYGQLGAALGLGGILGPALGGALAAIDLRAPFWIAALLSLASCVYGLCVLPESLPRPARRALIWRTMHPLGAVRSLLAAHPELLGWSFSLLLYMFARTGVATVMFVYVSYRFAWSPQVIGLFAAGIALATIVVQAGLVGWVVARLGESRAMLVGVACTATGMLAAGLAQDGFMFAAVSFLGVLGGIATPAQGAILNRIIGPRHRGQLAGVTRSLSNLAAMAAPLAFAHILSSTYEPDGTSVWAGAAFLAAGGLVLAAGVVAAASLAGASDTEVRRSPP